MAPFRNGSKHRSDASRLSASPVAPPPIRFLKPVFNGILKSPLRSNRESVDISKLSLASPPRAKILPQSLPENICPPGRPSPPPQRRRRPRKPRIPHPFQYKTPETSPRRKPQTPRHSFRSSRNSEPRFDDLVGRGSPSRPQDRDDIDPAPFGGYDGEYDPFGSNAAPLEDDRNDNEENYAPYNFPAPVGEENENFWGNEDDEINQTQLAMNREPQELLNESLEVIKERIRERTPQYRQALERTTLTHARMSDRCYILQDWHPKRFYLKFSIYRHIFRMPDPDGNMVLSCDCSDFRKTNLCFHIELVDRFGDEMMPYALTDGEDPCSFIITLERNRLFVSVATKFGSETRHTDKRTIVELAYKTRTWKCKSCPKQRYNSFVDLAYGNRDCQHIRAAIEEAEGGDFLKDEMDDAEVRAHASESLNSRVTSRSPPSLSYLPVVPPAWLRLPGEELEKPFDNGAHLPPVFKLNSKARCSCGSREGVNPTVTEIVVYTMSRAIPLLIETTYCLRCPNKKGRVGPDLGEFGVFNYNNRSAFSHELMNNYTSQFTTSMTPLFAFRQTIINVYTSERSPRPFVSDYIFSAAYFGFIRIQQLEVPMRCLYCKDEPAVIIADGVSIGFSNDKVVRLKPPTICDKEMGQVVRLPKRNSRRLLRSTCFLGERNLRIKFQNALELTKYEEVCQELLKLMGDNDEAFRDGALHMAIWECLGIFIQTHEDNGTLPMRFRQLLREIFSNDSILQLVQPRAIPALRRYSLGDPSHNVAPVIPAFGMIIQNLTTETLMQLVEPCLRQLAKALADRAELVLNNLISERTVPNPGHDIDNETDLLDKWETTGAYYGRSRQRLRPFYKGRDKDSGSRNKREDICNKYYESYKKQKLTGGIMALWCPHVVCLGYHMMPSAEGRDDVFSAILTYWEKAPEIVVYDFACQLAPYCLAREPEFFRDTMFVIDKMHSQGHSNCSQSFFLQNYTLTRPDLKHVNSSAAECGNSGLSRIRKSVSYMSEAHAILYVHTYLSVWNRRRLITFQNDVDQQLKALNPTYLAYGDNLDYESE